MSARKLGLLVIMAVMLAALGVVARDDLPGRNYVGQTDYIGSSGVVSGDLDMGGHNILSLGNLNLNGADIRTSGTLTANSATPSIASGSWFLTGVNSAPVTVTGFTGGTTGQVFTVCGNSGATNFVTIANGGNFTLNGAFAALTPGACIVLHADTASTFSQRGLMQNVVELSGRQTVAPSGTSDYALRIAQTLNSNASTTSKFYNGEWFNLTETDASGWLAANRYLMRKQVGGVDKFTVLDTGATVSATSVQAPFHVDASADPSDTGAYRCGNNVACLSAENSTPGTDGTITYNSANQWAFNSAVTATGALVSSASGVQAADASPFLWATRASLRSPADSKVTLGNNGGTTGVRLDASSDGVLDVQTFAGAATGVVKSSRFVDASADPADNTTGISLGSTAQICWERTTPGTDSCIGPMTGNSAFTFNGGIAMANDVTISMGTAGDVALRYSTVQTPDTGLLTTGATGNSLVIAENADAGTDFAHALQTNPTVFIQSADATNVQQYSSLSYNTLTTSAGTKGARTSLVGAEATLTCASSATLVTSGLIPDGSFLYGVTTRITTALTGAGLTGYSVGDGVTATMYGVNAAVTLASTTTPASGTVNIPNPQLNAGEVTLTFVGGLCATGAVHVVAHYLTLSADTAN